MSVSIYGGGGLDDSMVPIAADPECETMKKLRMKFNPSYQRRNPAATRKQQTQNLGFGEGISPVRLGDYEKKIERAPVKNF